MATATNTTIYDYEYMDEAQIDSELKCVICIRPFQNPANLPCQHTFCQHCIKAWLKSKTSCPTCRQTFPKQDGTSPVSPIKARIVINQLDRLLIRCKECRQINIQRGDLLDHQSKCTKMLVLCSSADMQCPWTGPRDEQANHMATCLFEQLRPVITPLQVEFRKSTEKLRRELDKQASQISFLCAFINKGNLMRTRCKTSSTLCKYLSADRKTTSEQVFPCVLCRERMRKCDVSLHACSFTSDCDCICSKCYDQYCSQKDNEASESEDDGEEDDESSSVDDD